MDKPKCRVCGEKHWSTEPHQFDVNTAAVNTPGVNTEVNRLKSRIAELEARIRELEGRPKTDRKAYMREYMRRRRAG